MQNTNIRCIASEMQNQRHTLKPITEQYERDNRKPVILDFKAATHALIGDNYNKDNRHINYIHSYPGRIFPYIPLYILSLYDFIHLDGYLLDPFAGSGTILLESIINPFVKRNSIGVEINPLARLISRVKTTPMDFSRIDQFTRELGKRYSQSADGETYVPSFKNLDLWFSPKAAERLAKLRYSIENLDISSDYRDFFWVCFSSVVRKVSKADPYIPPPVVLKPEKYKNSPRYERLKALLESVENPDVWALFEEVVNNNRTRLETLHNFEEVRNGKVTAEVIWDDARRVKKGLLSERGKIVKDSATVLPTNSIDIICTSPPYLTAQKYIRTTRLELLWLGYTEEEVRDLVKTSIGTERVSAESGFYVSPLGIDSIDSLVDDTLCKSRVRGSMVYGYFKNMIKALKEMYRLLSNGGYAVLVVGSNKVLGKRVRTYRLLTDAAISLGFREITILRDEIRTRSMMTARNGTGGLIRDEYIIILKKEL